VHEIGTGKLFDFFHLASQGNTAFSVKHMYFVRQQMHLATAIAVVPYNTQITKIVEFYMSGVPLLMPSERLLTEWHLDFDVILHRTPQMMPHDKGDHRYDWVYDAYPETALGPCCMHGVVENKSAAPVWTKFSDMLQVCVCVCMCVYVYVSARFFHAPYLLSRFCLSSGRM
jgi:hypothetical protein